MSVCIQGVPMWPLPMMHRTTLYRASDPGPPRTSDMGSLGPAPLLLSSGDHYRRPLKTCSLEDSKPTDTDIWWPPKHVQLASRQYTSYWNTFSFFIFKQTGGYTAQFRLYHLLMYCHCQSPWAKNTATYSTQPTQPTKPIESCASGMQSTQPKKSEWHKIKILSKLIKILSKLSETTCQHNIIDSLFHAIFAYMYAYR